MNKYKVIWTRTSKNDLERIIGYIAERDSIAAASKIYKKIKAGALNIENYPKKGKIVPELSKHNIISYHEHIIPPWRIIYRIENQIVYILAIIDGRRNIEDILMDRFMNL
ncbi:MAG: type II toxin-antitoxin system RelE/ParE family toxin [Spirochaetales bacterium]|nr:type II toxin-antitoxin system RelE/ParE family toxin [Spirochaetales bacterium]